MIEESYVKSRQEGVAMGCKLVAANFLQLINYEANNNFEDRDILYSYKNIVYNDNPLTSDDHFNWLNLLLPYIN